MRTRANDPQKVKELMESIVEIGLQVPVRLTSKRLSFQVPTKFGVFLSPSTCKIDQ